MIEQEYFFISKWKKITNIKSLKSWLDNECYLDRGNGLRNIALSKYLILCGKTFSEKLFWNLLYIELWWNSFYDRRVQKKCFYCQCRKKFKFVRGIIWQVFWKFLPRKNHNRGFYRVTKAPFSSICAKRSNTSPGRSFCRESRSKDVCKKVETLPKKSRISAPPKTIQKCNEKTWDSTIGSNSKNRFLRGKYSF